MSNDDREDLRAVGMVTFRTLMVLVVFFAGIIFPIAVILIALYPE